jgi:hypothetical protein
MLQPYRGCIWTKILREISNPDKHRHLTVLLGEWNVSQTIECGAQGSFHDRSGEVVPAAADTKNDSHIDFEHTMKIYFPDGSSVFETPTSLSRDVTATINSFRSEF